MTIGPEDAEIVKSWIEAACRRTVQETDERRYRDRVAIFAELNVDWERRERSSDPDAPYSRSELRGAIRGGVLSERDHLERERLKAQRALTWRDAVRWAIGGIIGIGTAILTWFLNTTHRP